MAILNHGSTIRTADGGQSTTTIVTASNIGSYAVASSATYYIGTTQNVFNRASGAQTLTGVSIDGNAATVTNGVYTTGEQTIAGAKTFNSAASFSANAFLTGSSELFIGSYMSLQSSSTIMGMVGFNRKVSDGTIFNSSYAAYQLHNNTGTLNLQVYSSAGGFVGAHTFNSSGNVTFLGTVSAATDFRAPVFYDSNNTAYYIDPASTSVLNKINLNSAGVAAIQWRAAGVGTIVGGYPFYNNASYGSINIEVSDNDTGGLVIDNEGVTVYGAADNGQLFRTIDEDVYQTNGNNVANATTFWINQGADGGGTIRGSFTATTDFRAPIFYDSGNTAYYIDPASTSRVSTLYVAGSLADSSSANGRIILSGNLHIDAYGGYDIYCNYYSGRAFRTYKGVATGAETFRADTDGIIYAFEQFRTPIIYDYNNTSYYLDPSSTTVINALSVTTLNNINAANGTWHTSSEGKARFYFASNGTTYFRTGNDYVFRNNSDIGVVVIDSVGNLRTSTSGDNSPSYSLHVGGTGFASADFRAPIFYDSGDTNYYLDPAGTSRLNTTRIGNINVGSGTYLNTITPIGDTNINLSAPSGAFYFDTFPRMPGFYDSADTTYYIDPAGSTSINVNGYIISSGTGGNKGAILGNLQVGYAGTYNTVQTPTNADTIWLQYSHSGNVGLAYGGGYTIAYNSIRSPIFYDSNNTAYYCDPNSTSNLYYIQMPYIANGSANILVNNGGSENWNAIKISGGNDQNGIGYSNTSHSAFGRNNLSFHVHSSDSIRLHSSGWDTLFEVAGSSGNAWLKGGLFSEGFTRLVNPGGAYYVTSTSSVTGAIKIRLPRLKVDCMMRMTVKIYQYNTGQCATIECGGYDYSGDGIWRNIFAYQNSDLFGTVNVRFGNDGTYDCIWIGETSSTWSYPQVFVTDFQAGYGNYTSDWGTGWSISYVTAFDTVTDTRVAYKTLNTSNVLYVGTTSIALNRSSASQTLTGVSIDGNSATTTLATKATRANGNFYIDDNYGNTVVGLYAASRYQGIFAMGDSYKLPADGTTTGNLYGIAWSHPNAGGAAGNLSTHGALILENGSYIAAISSSIRCTADMRTPIYYDSNNTAYYIDAASTSNLNNLTVANDLTVNGNTYLGNANNDTVYVNDTIRIGATDSGDASLFFGEGSVAGSDYGARWYWDSGYTFYWYTRNNGTDTQLFNYVTNDLSYVNWNRNFNMQNYAINYNAQIHFNAGTRFVGNNTQYLIFKSDATSLGGIQIKDGSDALKGYIGYWDSGGGGILNNTGNWAVRYNFGSSSSGGTLYGTWNSDTDFRAPIFYDSNNTTYYLDPASLSNIRHTIFHVGSNVVGATGVGVLFDGNYTSGQYRHRFRKYDDGAGLPLYIDYAHATANSFTAIARFGGGGSYNPFSVYGTADASGDFRAPIFYDSDNTGYYLNPAGNSQLSSVFVNDWFRAQGNTGLYFQDKGYGITSAGAAGNSYGNASTYGTGVNGWQGWGIGSRHCLMSNGGDNVGIHDNSRSWLYYWDGTYHRFQYGYLQSANSVRGPLFYDSDNTAYYLDPANTGTSLLVAGKVGIGTTSPTYKLQIGTVGSLDDSIRIGTYQVAKNTRQYIGNTRDDNGLFESAGNGDTPSTVLGGVAGIRIVNTEGTLYAPQADNSVQLLTHIYNGGSRVALHANYNGNVGIGTTSPSQTLHVVGTGFASSDFRSPIFYDSNDTTYYIDAASTSQLNQVASYYLRNLAGVSTDHQFGLYFNNSIDTAYAIYREGGAWTNPYPDLRIAFHTGIKIGANAGYNGVRFYDDYGMGTQVMSVNNGSDGLGANNVYVNNSLQAGSSLRAPIFYDSNDTAYYGDFNNTGVSVNAAGAVRGKYYVASNYDSTGYTQYKGYDNNNHFIVVRGYVGGTTTTPSITGGHATTFVEYAEANDSTGWFFRTAGTGNYDIVSRITRSYSSFEGSARAPIFYDSNNTAYYVDPNSTSNLVGLTVANTITGSVSGSSGSCTGNSATATRTSSQSGYPHAGTGMFAFYNWGGTDGGTSAPSASTYTTGISVGSNPGDQAYGFQIANNMWNTGLWTRNYNSSFGAWIRLLDSSNYVGYSAFTGNVDGTQFRDANNTAYYIDPASTSNLVGLTVANTITGAVSGNAGSVTINYNNDSNSTYQMLWGSGNNVYGTAGVYLNPSTDYVTATSFNASDWFRSSGATGWYNSTYGGGIYMNDTTWVRIYNNKYLYCDTIIQAGSDMRSPVYYDANDTAYYVDAASTSNLLLVKTRNTFGERVAVSATASTTINTQYNVTELTLAATITTLTLSNIQASGTVHMWTIVTVGGGVGYSITWPAAVKWPGGTAPTLTTTSNKRDIYQFVTYDGGTTIFAIIVGQNL